MHAHTLSWPHSTALAERPPAPQAHYIAAAQHGAAPPLPAARAHPACRAPPKHFSSNAKSHRQYSFPQVLERGERIEVIVDKTEDLQSQADQFRRQGRDLRNKMWWQNMKMKLLIAAAVILLIIVIFSSICFSGGNRCF